MLNQIIQLFCWAPKWLWLGLLTKPQSGSIHVILPFLCAENSTYFNSYKLAKINHFITQWYLGGYTRVDKLAYLQFFSFLIDLSNSFYHTHWCGDICYIGELENKTSDPGSMWYFRYFKHLYHLGIEPRPPEQESYMIPLHWLVCWYSWAITHIPLDAIAFFQSALALSWGKCIEKDIIHNSFTACLIRSGWLEIYDEPLFLLGL